MEVVNKYSFQNRYTDVASIKENPKSLQSEHLRKSCGRDNPAGALRSGLLKSKGLRTEIIFFFFAGYRDPSEEMKRGQLICGSEKDNSQCGVFVLPPCWAAREPVDMVV